MQDQVYVIKKNGIGKPLAYEKSRYAKLEPTLTAAGYRKATLDEIKKYYEVIEVTETPVKPTSEPKKSTKSENE